MNTYCFRKKLMFCMMLMFPATLSANTVIFGGYIDTVSVDGDPAHKVPPHINVMRTWDGRDDDYHFRRVEITDRCTCFLDGKKLSASEFIKAVKPGMAVRVLHDLYYIRAYTDSGLLPASPDAALGTKGALTVRLADIGPMVCTRIGEQTGRLDTRRPDFVLHLQLEGGRLVGGIAIATCVGAPWHEVDISGLTYKAGKLTGIVKSSLRFVGRTLNGKPSQDCAFTLDAGIAADGTLTGTYGGTVDEKKVAGKVDGQVQAARDLRGDLGVWVRLDYDEEGEGHGVRAGRWTFLRKGGTFVGGPASLTHGYMSGQVEKGSFQIEGSSFRAEFSGHGQLEKDKMSFTLKGQIAGDIIYGTFTDAAGKTGRCRGELRRPEAPAVWGWSESKLKRHMASGAYPD